MKTPRGNACWREASLETQHAGVSGKQLGSPTQSFPSVGIYRLEQVTSTQSFPSIGICLSRWASCHWKFLSRALATISEECFEEFLGGKVIVSDFVGRFHSSCHRTECDSMCLKSTWNLQQVESTCRGQALPMGTTLTLCYQPEHCNGMFRVSLAFSCSEHKHLHLICILDGDYHAMLSVLLDLCTLTRTYRERFSIYVWVEVFQGQDSSLL